MNLEAWLRQEHSLTDQLAVIEGLCTAVHEGHQRGVLHRALEPANVEVGSDARCSIQAAMRAESATAAGARYRAPEVLEGASYSPQADIYSVGVICYEMLSGRPPSGADRPQPLGELRPEVSRDLTDAIMGCLERGSDWRPRDLSYLLQVVATLRGAAGRSTAPAVRAPEVPPAPVPAPAKRAPARRAASRSNVPLLALILILVGGGIAGAWFWLRSPGPKPSAFQPAPAPAPPAPAPPVSSPPALAPPASAPPAPEVEPSAPPSPPAVATPQPRPLAEPETVKTPVPEPTREPARPEPPPLAAATPRPQVEAPGAVARTIPVQAATPPPLLAPEEPAPPAVLTAVSPLTIKRPSTALLDLRGVGLRPDHQVRIIKLKAPPDGITVVRQKFVNPTLIQVVLRLDQAAAPGVYGVGVADPQGSLSNSLSVTVTK